MNALGPEPEPEKPSEQSEDKPADRRGAVIVLAVTAALVVGGYFLIMKLREMGRLQDCYMQGRTNCARIQIR